MVFGNTDTVEAATSVQAVLAAAVATLCGVLVFVFKVWMPKVVQDGRDDNKMMIGHLLKEAERNRTFISAEMAKQDAVIEKIADRVAEMNDKIETCPHRINLHA